LDLKKEDLLKIIGMELGPMRIKCAILSLMALKEGVLEYKQENE